MERRAEDLKKKKKKKDFVDEGKENPKLSHESIRTKGLGVIEIEMLNECKVPMCIHRRRYITFDTTMMGWKVLRLLDKILISS